MIRISLPYLAGVFTALENLDRLVETHTILQGWSLAFEAEQQVKGLFNQSVYSGALRSSRGPGDAFTRVLQEFSSNQNLDEPIGQARLWNIKFHRDRFRVAFLAELEVMPSYFVTQKEGFDTLTLLNWGQNLFPISLAVKAPEAIFDAAEAAKALAFEMPTATSFHLFRVLEAVLRLYYTEVTNGEALPKVRTLGVYVRSLRNSGQGNRKVLSALDQIRDQYRNPLIHPEAVLDMEGAVSLLGIVRSVVGMMLNELPNAQLTTTTAA